MEGPGYRDVVSDVDEVALVGGEAATRYKLERYDDELYDIYDRAFVRGDVAGCPDCTGFITQTVKAGRARAETPGATDPPPASYPLDQFEAILRSFRSPDMAADGGSGGDMEGTVVPIASPVPTFLLQIADTRRFDK